MKKIIKAIDYQFGVEWVALNDDPMEMDWKEIKSYISTSLLADLCGMSTARVAKDIVRVRKNEADKRRKKNP